jgi:hypothetical protein
MNQGIKYDDPEIIFFDDDKKNIYDIQNATDIMCIPVNPEKGITKDVINLV